MTPTYYTPEIEEFCVGFEFELMYRVRGEYIPFKMVSLERIESIKGNYWGTMHHYNSKNFRVKHLDREDIEGEGWEYDCRFESGNSELFYQDIFIIKEPTQIHKLYINQDFFVKISRWKIVSPNAPITSTIFSGTIRNLTEFRKLMKQLWIKK